MLHIHFLPRFTSQNGSTEALYVDFGYTVEYVEHADPLVQSLDVTTPSKGCPSAHAY